MCGYSKCMAALEFHHRDSSKKSFSISSYNGGWTDLLISELDGCDLLCSNCHREIHYALI